jgi:hypothetical protein
MLLSPCTAPASCPEVAGLVEARRVIGLLEMDEFTKATADYVEALNQHREIYARTLHAQDEQSRKEYEASYERVHAANKRWHDVFNPGGSRTRQ